MFIVQIKVILNKKLSLREEGPPEEAAARGWGVAGRWWSTMGVVADGKQSPTAAVGIRVRSNVLGGRGLGI